jgi:hypothetical protein
MLSAKGSNGMLYVSGAIPDPKSRTYTCPRPKCGKQVSHVSEHDRSLTIKVCEHFRHPADASHPVKHYNWQIGNVVTAVRDGFKGLNGYDVAVDRFFPDNINRTEYYGELGITDKVLGYEAVVRVESENFNAEEFHAMLRHLSSQGKYTMLLLSAQGTSNSSGKYFRDYWNTRYPSRKGLKKIAGNELAVHELLGELSYFDHDTQEFFSSGFGDYVEDRKYDYNEGEWVDGETEFKTLKRPAEKMRAKQFVPVFITRGNGLKIARMHAVDSTRSAALNSLYELRKAIDLKDNDAVDAHGETFSQITEKFPDDDHVVKVYDNLLKQFKA